MIFRSKVEFMGSSCKIAGGIVAARSRRTPLVCAVPLAICCEGRRGACERAEMAEEAVGPCAAALMVWGRAVDNPVAGSALPGGHSPRVGFFRAAQLPISPVGGWTAPPFRWVVGANTVEVDEAEAVEAMEEEEFCRCAVFRGPGANILPASSGFAAAAKSPLPPPPLDVHLLDWKEVKGCATAVICGEGPRGRQVLYAGCPAWLGRVLLLVEGDAG